MLDFHLDWCIIEFHKNAQQNLAVSWNRFKESWICLWIWTKVSWVLPWATPHPTAKF